MTNQSTSDFSSPWLVIGVTCPPASHPFWPGAFFVRGGLCPKWKRLHGRAILANQDGGTTPALFQQAQTDAVAMRRFTKVLRPAGGWLTGTLTPWRNR
jgi:hypothetical protein